MKPDPERRKGLPWQAAPTDDQKPKPFDASARPEELQAALAAGAFIVGGVFSHDVQTYQQLVQAGLELRKLAAKCPSCGTRVCKTDWTGDGINVPRSLLFCRCVAVLQLAQAPDPGSALWSSFSAMLQQHGYWVALRSKQDFFGVN
jgi:hypothetical protein